MGKLEWPGRLQLGGQLALVAPGDLLEAPWVDGVFFSEPLRKKVPRFGSIFLLKP